MLELLRRWVGWCAFLFAGPALAAPPCPASLAAWQVGRGELHADRVCGRFLLATDAQDHELSEAEVNLRAPVQVPYAVEVSWRRLGPEAGMNLALAVVGAHVLFAHEGVALYVTPAQFREQGYTKVPGLALHEEHRVRVAQTASEVLVVVDGREVARYPFRAPRAGGRVGIYLEGARGYRSRVLFRDFVVSSQ